MDLLNMTSLSFMSSSNKVCFIVFALFSLIITSNKVYSVSIYDIYTTPAWYMSLSILLSSGLYTTTLLHFTITIADYLYIVELFLNTAKKPRCLDHVDRLLRRKDEATMGKLFVVLKHYLICCNIYSEAKLVANQLFLVYFSCCLYIS